MKRASNAALWLILAALGPACSKPAGPSPKPGASASAGPARSNEQKLRDLLQAELQRDPAGVAPDDLIAEDATVRAAAVRALARIEDDKSFEALAKALADAEPDVLGWAAFGVGQLCRGHETDAVRRLALRAATLAADPVTELRDRAIATLALALGRCASDDAERSLRAWLKLRPTVAEAAMLGLGEVARTRKHLDDATVAALLDSAAQSPQTPALYAIESLPTLGAAARARLLEVAQKALDQAGPGRAFAARALAKAGAEAAAPLRQFIESETATDTERADAARSLAALGAPAQTELAAALKSRARSLIDGKAWVSSQHGAVLTLLEGLEPKSADPTLLAELAALPLQGEPPPVARRKIMLRCRAAALLAGKASASATLLACDPSPPAEQREGWLARLKVLARGPLDKERGARFQELARSGDRVVREAALELLQQHDEVQDIPAILAEALSAKEVGVRATAAKVLAHYPARAATDTRVIQALTQQLSEVGKTNNIELAGWLLDAAVALELLGAKPALERACVAANVTLRQHAERGYAALGEREHRCPNVPGKDALAATTPGDLQIDFDTDVGPLRLSLWGGRSPFAVQRFAELARGGFYDGTVVHRVVPGFVVQFGDPDGDGFGTPPEQPPLRCQLGFDRFETGAVGVALAGRDTGSSQFFVTLRPTPHLMGQYSLVGQAAPGWEKLAAGDRLLHAIVH
ncbi:MAG TPA: peptidylprolyl isomerase [Polyangiaceae bacterium]|nr:peptidylprolyl isomerase [Polyangiaceae bacterium]